MEEDYIMETVNERRRFVKGIGFFAALLGGGAAASAANTYAAVGTSNVPNPVVVPVSEPVVEDISHLAPPGNPPTLQLTGAYEKKPKPTNIDDNPYFIVSNPIITHSVTMAVGLDNRLWIKVGEEWKRVALEA